MTQNGSCDDRFGLSPKEIKLLDAAREQSTPDWMGSVGRMFLVLGLLLLVGGALKSAGEIAMGVHHAYETTSDILVAGLIYYKGHSMVRESRYIRITKYLLRRSPDALGS
jgi:hypothetical protein